MNVENPVAFSFIMQDDIYLLEADRSQYSAPAKTMDAAAEPEPVYTAATVLEAIVEKPQPVEFKFLGGNKKKFLVITHYPDADFMHDRHLAALESTLARLSITRDDMAIVNRAVYADASIESLTVFFNPQKLLLLGKNSLPDGTENTALNKLTQLGDIRTLFTFSFDEMMDSVDNKKAFWEQMKQF